MWHHRAGAAEHGIEIGVQDKVPLLVAMLVDLLPDAGTGIIVENIDSAESIDGVFYGSIQVFLFSDIAIGEDGLSAFFVFDQLVDARRDRLLNIAADYFGALAREQARRRAPNAAIGSRHDRNFALEPSQSRAQHLMLVG